MDAHLSFAPRMVAERAERLVPQGLRPSRRVGSLLCAPGDSLSPYGASGDPTQPPRSFPWLSDSSRKITPVETVSGAREKLLSAGGSRTALHPRPEVELEATALYLSQMDVIQTQLSGDTTVRDAVRLPLR